MYMGALYSSVFLLAVANPMLLHSMFACSANTLMFAISLVDTV